MELFFASAGRMGRGAFLLTTAAIVALFAVYEHGVRGGVHAATAWLAHFVLFVAAVSVLSKRLHDRGRSGWWSAPIMLAFILAWPEPRGWFGWLAIAALVWPAVDLGVMPGQAGFNRFGGPRR